MFPVMKHTTSLVIPTYIQMNESVNTPNAIEVLRVSRVLELRLTLVEEELVKGR